jgi:hypothetical protein
VFELVTEPLEAPPAGVVGFEAAGEVEAANSTGFPVSSTG